MDEPTRIEACARAVQEANLAYCLAIGDPRQLHWDNAPEWQKNRIVHWVACALRGNTPEESHSLWLDRNTRDGRKYGTIKDPDKKEHPYMVPYEALPPEIRVKNDLCVSTVRAVYTALGGKLAPVDPECGYLADLSDVTEAIRDQTRVGVTLIDYFAGLFAQELLRQTDQVESERFLLCYAESAYDYARHMLEAREAHFHKFGMDAHNPWVPLKLHKDAP